MNSFKATWMQLNSIQFIDLKIKLNFNKIEILCLCSNLSLIINYWKDLKYCMINMKIDKACRATDDMMRKNRFLNKIWLKFRRNNSKFNFVLTIWKMHKHGTILIVMHFSEMFMYVKWINRYFIIFLMLITLRSVIFLEICLLFNILYDIMSIN